MRAVFVINIRAGSAQHRDLHERIVTTCDQNGFECQTLVCRGQSITDLTRSALNSRPDVVIAAGGDGTISAVASVVAGSGVPLGVLPVGTLNHFAKDAGIPPDLDAAIRTALTGTPVSVDVGEVNGRIFLNNSSLGLYPILVEERTEQQSRGTGKWPAFFRAVLSVLWRYPLLHIFVSTDTGQVSRTTPFVFVGNNVYDVKGVKVGSRDSLDSGQLFVLLSRHVSRMQLLWNAARTLFSGAAPAFDCFVAREVVIRSSGPRSRVAIDGEVTTLQNPLNFHIRPGELRVMLPSAAAERAA